MNMPAMTPMVKAWELYANGVIAIGGIPQNDLESWMFLSKLIGYEEVMKELPSMNWTGRAVEDPKKAKKNANKRYTFWKPNGQKAAKDRTQQKMWNDHERAMAGTRGFGTTLQETRDALQTDDVWISDKMKQMLKKFVGNKEKRQLVLRRRWVTNAQRYDWIPRRHDEKVLWSLQTGQTTMEDIKADVHLRLIEHINFFLAKVCSEVLWAHVPRCGLLNRCTRRRCGKQEAISRLHERVSSRDVRKGEPVFKTVRVTPHLNFRSR